jgi:hypothetical protein
MKFLADENLNGDILSGLLRQNPAIEIIRVQDTDLAGASDPVLLEHAAQMGAIIITHDAKTLPKYAFERVEAGLSMPGVIEVRRNVSFAEAIADLSFLIAAGEASDFENQVRYVPLQ